MLQFPQSLLLHSVQPAADLRFHPLCLSEQFAAFRWELLRWKHLFLLDIPRIFPEAQISFFPEFFHKDGQCRLGDPDLMTQLCDIGPLGMMPQNIYEKVDLSPAIPLSSFFAHLPSHAAVKYHLAECRLMGKLRNVHMRTVRVLTVPSIWNSSADFLECEIQRCYNL